MASLPSSSVTTPSSLLSLLCYPFADPLQLLPLPCFLRYHFRYSLLSLFQKFIKYSHLLMVLSLFSSSFWLYTVMSVGSQREGRKTHMHFRKTSMNAVWRVNWRGNVADKQVMVFGLLPLDLCGMSITGQFWQHGVLWIASGAQNTTCWQPHSYSGVGVAGLPISQQISQHSEIIRCLISFIQQMARTLLPVFIFPEVRK